MSGPRHPTRRRLALRALASTSLLAGCGSLLPPANLAPPTLAFEGLVIDRVQWEQLHLKARITTYNPNAVDLPLSHVRFTLWLYGEPVAEGRVSQTRLVLPASSEMTVPVTLTIPTAALRRTVFKVARGQTGAAPLWEVRGSAQWGLIPVDIPFQKHGDASTLSGLWQWMSR